MLVDLIPQNCQGKNYRHRVKRVSAKERHMGLATRLRIILSKKLAGGEPTKTTCSTVKLFSPLPSRAGHPPQTKPIGLKSPRDTRLNTRRKLSTYAYALRPLSSLYIIDDNAKETASVTNPVPFLEAPVTLPEYVVEVVA